MDAEGEQAHQGAHQDVRLGKAAIDCYFGSQIGAQLVKHQLDSFNDLVGRRLEQIIDGFNPIDISNSWLPEQACYKYIISVTVVNPTLAKPTILEKDGSTKVMMPNDARLRNLTYAAPMTVDLVINARTYSPEANSHVVETKRINGVALGRLPIMVRSRQCVHHQRIGQHGHDECRYDYGGYFIINGSEKVVISQDRIAENRTYVFLNNKASSYSHSAEIRSVQDSRFGVPKTTTLRLTSKANQFGRCVRMTMHHVRVDIPVVIVMRALGVLNDLDIVRHVIYDENDPAASDVLRELAGCLDEGSCVRTQEEALEYIAAHLNHAGQASSPNHQSHAARLNAVRGVLRKDVLPHVGHEPQLKAAYIGYMLWRLMRGLMGLDPLDDRDSFINKRLDTPGALLASLFRQYYGKVVKDLRTQVSRDLKAGSWRTNQKLVHVINRSNVYKLFKQTIIESGLKYSLATGNWGAKTSRVRQGVAQVLNRMTYTATISHLRRVNTPIEKTGKLVQPRKLHPTQWGVICPAETPEGASVGLVKNLALLANVTIATPSEPVMQALQLLGARLLAPPEFDISMFAAGALRIFVNGSLVGTHPEPAQLMQELRLRKRSGALSVFTSIVWTVRTNVMAVSTEGGRFVRPLFVVDGATGRLVAESDGTVDRLLKSRAEQAGLDWMRDLVLSGAVEYMDVEEVNSALVAMQPSDLRAVSHQAYTHMELSPSVMLGVVAGSIPFSDHNQAPRNTYQCLHPDEPVLLACGASKRIGDVRVGDEVATFCPESSRLSTTRVTFQLERPMLEGQRMMEVAVSGGSRVLRATNDHRVMTTAGWQRVDQLVPGITLVGVHPSAPEHPVNVPATSANKALVTTQTATDRLLALGLPPALVSKYIALLSDTGVLPLLPFTQTAHSLARMCGYLRGGGGWARTIKKPTGAVATQCTFRFACMTDAAAFEADVVRLGFTRIEPKPSAHDGDTLCAADILMPSQYAFRAPSVVAGPPLRATVTHHGILPALLMALGEPDAVGDWVSHDGVRSEYAAGCMGAAAAIQGRHAKWDLSSGQKDARGGGEGGVGAVRYSWRAWASSALVSELGRCVLGESPLPSHVQLGGACARGGLLFMPVESVRDALEQPSTVADITVESPNHSFIGGKGAFAVSNSAMGKQAIGVYATNFRHRLDTMTHVLNYPQCPLVSTHTARLLNCNELPCGVNVTVAIACFTGFNQEDSVIVNRSAVDRGLFVSTFYRTLREQNNKNHSTGEEEFFCRPDPLTTRGMRPSNYAKLAPSGFVPEDSYVEAGDVIIGKCMPNKQGCIIQNKDASVTLKSNETGYVDRNCHGDNYFTNVTGDGYVFAKVRLRNQRVPTIGDKVSCYTPDHDVLTWEAGWVPVSKVTLQHHVASLLDGMLVYQRPCAVQRFVYQGPVVHVCSPSVDLLVTPEHRMLVRGDGSDWEVVTAEEMQQGIKEGPLAFCKHVSSGWGAVEVALDDVIKLDDAANKVPLRPWLDLFGTWLACGSTRNSARRPTLFPSTQRAMDRLLAATEALGVRTICSSGSSRVLLELDHPLTVYLMDYSGGGPAERGLPSWVWRLRRNACRLLMDALLSCGGYCCDSVQLGDLQRLCLHAGWACDAEFDTGPASHAPPLAVVSKTESALEPAVEAAHVSSELHDGHVYCCTVPRGDGIIYVRRNGRPVWCGNSRSGQKGTIGMMYRQEDMPYTASGLVPSLIMNPHAIPSRMTIGQLMEAIESKACAMEGRFGDATPFNARTVEDIASELEAVGMERYGNEIMYNPRTGEQVPCAVFIAPTYYQRLKHMVDDKVHCLTADHDVLTERGWVPIADVTMADQVATLHDGKRLVYEAPLEVMAFPGHKGRLFHALSAGVDLLTTLEHRMWVSMRGGAAPDAPHALVPARELLGERVRYQRNAEWTAPDCQVLLGKTGLPDRELPMRMDAWLDSFGAWVAAEGRADARHKGLPDWAWHLSARQAWRLVHAMLLGGKSPSYYTSSERLADDFGRLCLHAGVSATKHVHITGWRMSVIQETNQPSCRTKSVLPAEARPVYCLRVPSEVFYVRRNGKPCWTGNSRAANGPVVLLTRQPAEGRARDGGLRLGEMELECLWAHGGMFFLKERFMECSDNYRVFVCQRCGMMVPANPERKYYYCSVCKNMTDIAEARIPYACKLLLQEVESMAIGARFIT